ncbi:MAG: hypothetical protein ACXVP4_11875 [Bacteroidia bacterium]
MLEQSDISTTQWPSPKKFMFLLLVSYAFFYIFPFPLDAVPHSGFIFNHYESIIDRSINFIGKHILHIPGLRKQIYSDSGDTAFDYAKVFSYFLFATFTSIILFIFFNKKINYEKLNSLFFIFIRYCIGFYMLVYGFDKVFKSHFPFPNLEKLEQPFGNSSPQGLLWAFMGYSTSYSTFLGIIEVVSGFLLLFRRTVAFGALLALMIMINVVLINFSYDVPVKLFALHIVFFIVLILYPYLRSIINFFFLNKDAKLPEQPAAAFPKWIADYRKIIKAAVIIGFSVLFMNFSITNMNTDGDNAPKPYLYGIYISGPYQGQNIYSPHASIDEIIFDRKNTIFITSKDTQYYETQVDTIKKQVLFISNTNPRKTFLWNYNLTENELSFSGTGQACLGLRFIKKDLNSMPLMNTHFKWIEEFPFNN